MLTQNLNDLEFENEVQSLEISAWIYKEGLERSWIRFAFGPVHFHVFLNLSIFVMIRVCS